LVRELLSRKKQALVVCLILSTEQSPWNEIQEFGQNETFAGVNSSGLTYVRYSAHQAPIPPLVRIPVIFKTFQHWIFLSLSGSRCLGWLSNISLLRFGDAVLQKSHLWGLPKTHLQSNHLQGQSNSPDTIVTQSIEHSTLIGLKTLKAFQFLLDNYEFEYVFRTNSSSYVDGDLLVSFVSKLNVGDLYGGYIGESRKGLFASGAGILMSKSLVQKVLSNGSKWRHGLIDDVALARLIQEAVQPKLNITPLPRGHFESVDEVWQATGEEIKSGFHFRCKTDSPNKTIQIMKAIWLRKKTN
jgi:hypothetical protein